MTESLRPPRLGGPGRRAVVLAQLLPALALLGCEAEPSAAADPAALVHPPPPSPVLTRERDAAVPPGFPLELPDLDEVLDGQRLTTRDGAEIFSLSARAQSEDIDDVAAALTAALDDHDLRVETTRVAAGQGQLTLLDARDDDCTIEVGAIIQTETRAVGDPGVSFILTWTARQPDARAAARSASR